MWEREADYSKEHLISEQQQYSHESKFERLEHELELLSEQPYFGRVNNRSRANLGEVAYLPCRVKFMQDGYMVRNEIVFGKLVRHFSLAVRLSSLSLFNFYDSFPILFQQFNFENPILIMLRDWTIIIHQKLSSYDV